MQNAGNASSGRLLPLDAMRGVAALVVAFHHCQQNFQTQFGPGFAYGYIAVDVFFLMSGYVIAHAYEAKMAQGAKGHLSVWGFFVVRMKRLYPMLAFGALLGGGIAFALGRFPAWALATLSSLTFLPLVAKDMAMYPINAVQWSVTIEIIINMLHRILVRWLNIWVLAALAAASYALTVYAVWTLEDVSNGWAKFNFWAGIPRAGYPYFMGVLIYRLTQAGKLKVPSLPAPLVLAAFVAVVMFQPLISPPFSKNLYWLLVVGLVFPPMLVLLVQSTLSPRLEGTAKFLGDISYPLYATHGPLIVIAAPLMFAIDLGPRHLAVLALITGFVLFAWAVDRLYDRPIRARLAGRRPAPPPAANAAAP